MPDALPEEPTAAVAGSTPPDRAGAGLDLCPLSSLRISDRNPRTTAVSDAEVASLAESIALLGLQQNLIGYGGAGGTVYIAGGGLRLRALQRLAGERRVGLHEPIPVMVHASEEAAVEAAVAENEVRRQMAVLDQYHAYRAMRDAGHGLARIAAGMATDEAQVARVLALDRASTLVLKALGGGELTLAQARAFTVEPDAGVQDALLARWDKLGHWDREPSAIRRLLREQGGARRTELKLAAVGRAAYAESGGTVTSDLFSDVEVIDDYGLVDRLFAARVEQLRAEALAEGWSWAEARDEAGPIDPDHSDEVEMGPEVWTPSEEEDALLERVAEKESLGYAVDPADAARAAGLRERGQAPADWSADQKSVAGVVVEFGPWRGLRVIKGVVRGPDIARARDLGLFGEDEEESLGAELSGEERPHDRLPESLRAELRSVRTVAVANAIAKDPELALDLLAWLILKPSYPQISTIRGGQGHVRGAAGLGLPLGFALIERGSGYGATVDWGESLADFRNSGRKRRDDILARWIAQSLDAVTGEARGGHILDPFAEIEAAAALRLREVWTPGEAFLARLSMAQLDALYRDLTGGTHGISDRLIKPRKDDAVDLVAELFAHPMVTEARIRAANWPVPGDLAARVDGWLPAPLRPAGGRGDG
mgnify:CR=1 FL=1